MTYAPRTPNEHGDNIAALVDAYARMDALKASHAKEIKKLRLEIRAYKDRIKRAEERDAHSPPQIADAAPPAEPTITPSNAPAPKLTDAERFAKFKASMLAHVPDITDEKLQGDWEYAEANRKNK